MYLPTTTKIHVEVQGSLPELGIPKMEAIKVLYRMSSELVSIAPFPSVFRNLVSLHVTLGKDYP